MQGGGQHKRIGFGAKSRISIVAGIALHDVCQRLKQGQQAVTLLVFRCGQVHQRVGKAKAVHFAAENFQVLAMRGVDLAHRDDLNFIPGVGGVGQNRGDGVTGRLCGGLGVIH